MREGHQADRWKRDDALDLQIPDRENCALYSTVIGNAGEGLWWNSPATGEWFSDRVFGANGTVGCYVPGDVVGDAPVEPDGLLRRFWWP